MAAAAERFNGFFSVTRSQVYRELPALAEQGLDADDDEISLRRMLKKDGGKTGLWEREA